MRRTIKVNELTSKINKVLVGHNTDFAGKEALATLLESILLETRNYKGFILLNPTDKPTYMDYDRKYL